MPDLAKRDSVSPSVLLKAAAIVFPSLWIYGPALRGPFLWDDLAEIPQNPVLRDPDGLAKIWSGAVGADYFPLKTSLQWFLCRLWGADPLAFHLLNLALHLLAALLVWRLLSRLGLKLAWLGGLFFAVHPLAVESAAWIAEFKNTLSEVFLLVSMIAFLSWDDSGRPIRGIFPVSGDYAWALAAFALALLSKSSVAMLPPCLILFAWWRRGRIGRADLAASAPFFGLSVLLGLVTVHFQYHRALSQWTIPLHGAFQHAALAGTATVFYLVKTLWPLGLHPMYRPWDVASASGFVLGSWAVLIALLLWLWSRRAPWSRSALFGLGYFVINLVPVLGFVPMSYLHIGWVADHFAYISLIGAAGLAAGAVEWLWRARPGLHAVTAAGVGLLAVALAAAGRADAAAFASEPALWGRVLALNPEAWMAEVDLGRYRAATGDPEQAIVHYDRALSIRTDLPEAYYNRGTALLSLGRLDQARSDFERTLRLQPDSPDALTNLGNALARSGRIPEAVDCYERALRIQPDAVDTRANLTRALIAVLRSALERRSMAEAFAACERLIRLDPNNVEAQADYGNLCVYQGRLEEAVAHYQIVLQLRPDDAATRANLTIVEGALRERGQAGR